MRLPSKPEALDNVDRTVGRDPSYPDRARIDSDVRAFLRPVSTPWIVFDRDSRCDDFGKSALRVGAVFASSPNFRPEVLEAASLTGRPLAEIVAQPIAGLEAPPSIKSASKDAFAPGAVLLPATTSILSEQGIFANVAEPPSRDTPIDPSNVIVATDLAPRLSAPPPPRKRRSVLWLAAGIAACALLGFGLRPKAKAPIVTAPVVHEVAQAAPPPVETVELDDVPAPEPPKKVAPAKQGFGKLTITSGARHKNVYLDGKRMLGQGQRSFLVFCGMHTIAVNDKTEAKDIEIPCNGEFTVSK